MNLIGHLACAQDRAPAFQLGSILPDLLGMMARRPRASHLVKFWQARGEMPPHVEAIIAGIAFHHWVDARFHGAPLFRDNARTLREALQAASQEPGMKRFFAAHVLLELYLDRILLREYPGLAEEFNNLLAEGQGGMLWTFAAAHPDVDGAALEKFTGRLYRGRFAEGYLSDEGIHYRVNHILQRLGQRNLNEPESSAVVSYFGAHAAPLRSALLEFIRAMRRYGGDSQINRSGAIIAGAHTSADSRRRFAGRVEAT